MCRSHATVRGFIGELVQRESGDGGGPEGGRDIIVDMEAGLEHLSRGTGRHVSQVVAVIEPYYRSMETGRRVAELAAELGVDSVVVVANKLRDEEDRHAIHEFCSAHGLPVVAEIPYDPSLVASEREGTPPIEKRPPGPAVQAVRDLARRLIS